MAEHFSPLFRYDSIYRLRILPTGFLSYHQLLVDLLMLGRPFYFNLGYFLLVFGRKRLKKYLKKLQLNLSLTIHKAIELTIQAKYSTNDYEFQSDELFNV